MKKVMMMALALVASATAFAGDSDALKAIKKAKTYADAAQLVKTAQLVNDEERAEAYNKLVDLAMDKVGKETGTIAQNQAAVQLGTGKEEAYDTLGLAEAICNAIDAAITCNKYDQLPNAKGKVKPQFADKNAQRIWAVRTHLVNIGQEEARKGNNAGVLKYWGAFLDSDTDPLFASQDHESEKGYIGQVAYFAGRYAFEAKELDRADKYFDIAMQDPEQKKDALTYKLYAAGSNLKSKEDSLKYIDQLKDLYNKEPENDVLLDKLFTMYDGLKDKAAQKALLDNHLAKYPNSFSALANKGMMAIADNNAEEGANWLRKAAVASPENAVIQTYLGTCLSVQAGQTDDAAKRKALYQEAVQALDKAKQLDPNKQQANWGYNRFQAYYNFYGADAPETKDAELDAK
ncbi:MAG: hypothetical protein IJ548_07615 [Paludibacteraceae bacterium]|nr:hypothetical protein [Paludibacteraceae bacterium]MBQ8714564.1 hypothetical protein [Prevotella sp.]